MNTRMLRGGLCSLLVFGGIFAGACGGPSAANIQLRKENQNLRDQITELNRQHDGDVATIKSNEATRGTLPSLPQERIEKLFTTHTIQIGRLTGQDDADTGLKVYISPVDEQGDEIKAAGAFKVDAFDLASGDKPLVGSWNFDTDRVRGLFYDHISLYTFVLPCPWKTKPSHEDLTVRVTFTDELTGREFTAQREIKVKVPTSATASR